MAPLAEKKFHHKKKMENMVFPICVSTSGQQKYPLPFIYLFILFIYLWNPKYATDRVVAILYSIFNRMHI